MPPYDNGAGASSFIGSATCQPSSSWAFNSKNDSSCAIASTFLGACSNAPEPVLLIPLNGTNHYTPPDTRTANQCTCSWMAYNLLSACTACQGFDTSNLNWDAYSQNCATFEGDGFFPSSAFLRDTIYIPVWATTNSTTWTERKFDVLQVQAMVAKDEPDIKLSPSTPPKSAVAGGIIGGITVLCAVILGIAAFFIFRMCRRRRNKINSQARWKQFDCKCSKTRQEKNPPLVVVPHQGSNLPALPAVQTRNVSSGGAQVSAHSTPRNSEPLAGGSRHVDNTDSSSRVQAKNVPPRTAPIFVRIYSSTRSHRTQVARRHEVVTGRDRVDAGGARRNTVATLSGLDSIYIPSTSDRHRPRAYFPLKSNSIPPLRMIETAPRARRNYSKSALRNEVRRKQLPRLVIMNP